MIADIFEALLQELGHSLGDVKLLPDQNNSCLIQFPNDQISIQVEVDRSAQFLLLGCKLGTVSGGKYQENLFREALKANALPPPLHGILGFSDKSRNIILFEKLTLKDLNGEKIAAEITPFVDKAKVWSEALKHNDVPIIQGASHSGGGMFGLRP